jgi:alpha-tubulin suppressor-like RCC1 family protein
MDSLTRFLPFASKSEDVEELKSPDGTPIVKVSFASKHSAFVTEKGNVYIRGKVKYALGLGENVDEAHDYTHVKGLPRIVDVCCGKDHTVVLSDDGKVFTWGWGGNVLTSGSLGHGDQVSIATPKQVQALDSEKIVQISSGYENCLALTADGRVFSWGNGANGRLGKIT